jgi:hypothetical protein
MCVGGGLTHASTLNAPTATDTRTICTVAFHCAKSWWQGTVVRGRLSRTTRTAITAFLIIAQQSDLDHQCRHNFWIKFFPTATAQGCRQHNVTKTGTNQATDRQTNGLEHSAHFAITSLVERDAIPAVTAFSANEFDHAETCGAILKHHAVDQGLTLFGT